MIQSRKGQSGHIDIMPGVQTHRLITSYNKEKRISTPFQSLLGVYIYMYIYMIHIYICIYTNKSAMLHGSSSSLKLRMMMIMIIITVTIMIMRRIILTESACVCYI